MTDPEEDPQLAKSSARTERKEGKRRVVIVFIFINFCWVCSVHHETDTFYGKLFIAISQHHVFWGNF